MRVGIAGLGLIGGSLALALRDRHEVTGYDVDPATCEQARRADLRIVTRLDELLPADLVIVATPIAALLPTLAELAPRAGEAVLADVASVRGPVEAFARELGAAARIVGMHPMAGMTASGFRSADAALFRGRSFLVVPAAGADARALALVGEIARDAGGVVIVCSALEHDRVVALTSALPLALAVALSVSAADGATELAPFAGPGFRDTTRLAATGADLAEAMLLANSANVVVAIARLRTALDDLERAIADRDAAGLRAVLERARTVRARLD